MPGICATKHEDDHRCKVDFNDHRECSDPSSNQPLPVFIRLTCHMRWERVRLAPDHMSDACVSCKGMEAIR